MTTLDRKCK